MSAEQLVHASYRGLEIGEQLKLFDFGPTTAHLEFAQPLPHGTVLQLKTDGGLEIPVTVVRVHEQSDEAEVAPGMRVHAELSGDANAWWAALVSIEDPVIPTPALVAEVLAEPEPTAEVQVAPGAQGEAEAEAGAEPEAVAEPEPEAVPDPVEAQVTNPVESRTSTKRTQIMNVAEIQAAIADVDKEAAAAAATAESDGAKTQQISQDELKAVLEQERAAAQPKEDDPKKKKKRRRKKKR